jgi:hypothetical protein
MSNAVQTMLTVLTQTPLPFALVGAGKGGSHRAVLPPLVYARQHNRSPKLRFSSR